jgi:hypothetical protein
VSSVARSAIRRTRARRAHLMVIFVPVTGWLARGGRPVSSCRRGHQTLRPVPAAAGCGGTARGSRRDAGRTPEGSGDAAAASGGGSPRPEPLISGAAPDSLPGVSEPAPGGGRRGRPGWRAEGVPLTGSPIRGSGAWSSSARKAHHYDGPTSAPSGPRHVPRLAFRACTSTISGTRAGRSRPLRARHSRN